MNLCYCDESGTGDEPIAVMVGVVVDASRMHLTKEHWQGLLDYLSELTGRQIVELHTRDFYPGNGIWRDLDGVRRAGVIASTFEWLGERKHHLVYASVLKESYFSALKNGDIPAELNTVWRFLGFHLVLAMQKHSKGESGVKGHTIFVFDNEERERMRFTDLILRPPAWSDEYYDRGKKDKQLCQIVDVPYFGDSREVVLLQFADVAAFFLRRYAEIKEGVPGRGPRYDGEEERITSWVQTLLGRSIGTAKIYPRRGRQYAHDMFFKHAPDSIRSL